MNARGVAADGDVGCEFVELSADSQLGSLIGGEMLAVSADNDRVIRGWHRAEGENWRQESIVGTVLDGSVEVVDGVIRPTVRGTAYVTAEATLIIDERDPLCWGIN